MKNSQSGEINYLQKPAFAIFDLDPVGDPLTSKVCLYLEDLDFIGVSHPKRTEIEDEHEQYIC